jgi:hypothetical protein
MCIIGEFPKKWEGISKNQEMGSGLPKKVFPVSRWRFEKRGMHEIAPIIWNKWDFWLSQELGKSLLWLLQGPLVTVPRSSLNYRQQLLLDNDETGYLAKYTQI